MAEGPTHECVPTDKNLADISNNIGKGWEFLAVDLKISQAQIDHIKADNKQSTQQQIYNMLVKWRSTEGCNATMKSLFDKMYNAAGVYIDWNRLQEMYGPWVDNMHQMRCDHVQQACSLVSMDIAKIGHIPAPIPSVPHVSLTVLQQDLIAYYRKWFSRLAMSPLIDEDEFDADFLEIYVKPILKIPCHQGPKGQSQSILCKSCHDIFVKDSKPCQNIYISSPAGCGKTSLAKWLALTWCQAHQPVVFDNKWFMAEDVNEMRTFMFLFIVFLRDEHEQQCDVDIMIQDQLLPNLANWVTYKKELEFLQGFLNSAKCIIILDGLDEWSHPPGNECTFKNKHIPHSRARPLCTTLTTSRPWKLDVVGLKPGDIDQRLELNGLEDDLLKRLISNVVTKINKVHVRGKEMKAHNFELLLEDRKLTDLSKIPVVVMQLLTVWFDNESLGESQCKIYSNMIEFVLKRYCKKRGNVSSEMDSIKIGDRSRDRQIPMCLQNQMYCKIHKELLLNLAALAYNTLFTDNEESSLVFDSKIAKKYLTDQEIEMSLAVGILTQEKVMCKMSIRQSHISFIHKTFQEYLAALYVALNPGIVRNVEEKIKHVCCSVKKILEMSQIFMFLNGLCPEIMLNLHENLRQTVSEESGTQRYRASCELDPLSSEGLTLKQVQDTMREWLVECRLNGHKKVTHLPVSDFFIGPWPDSDCLKSLYVNSPIFSLYVHDNDKTDKVFSPEKIDDILNSVTVSNSIQKLWLYRVSETFVVKLVTDHKHSLSVRPNAWRHLECVTLELVGMSGDTLCSLVDSILHLSKSVKVGLRRCIIKQQTKDWKVYIQSHSRLTVDDGVRYDVMGWDVHSLEFHTNKV